MGAIWSSCKCGYHSGDMLTSGMADWNRRLEELFVALCENCIEVVEVRLNKTINLSPGENQDSIVEANPQCPICSSENVILYDDDKVIGVKGDFTHYYRYESSIERGVEITNGTYKCPKCKEMTLEFYHANAHMVD